MNEKNSMIDLFENTFSEQMNNMWFHRNYYNQENRLPAIRLGFVSQGHVHMCVCVRMKNMDGRICFYWIFGYFD